MEYNSIKKKSSFIIFVIYLLYFLNNMHFLWIEYIECIVYMLYDVIKYNKISRKYFISRYEYYEKILP